jgi:hypothetical protein
MISQFTYFLGGSEFSATSGKATTSRRLTLDETDDQPFDCTPDSKAVIFISNRTGFIGSGSTKRHRDVGFGPEGCGDKSSFFRRLKELKIEDWTK